MLTDLPPSGALTCRVAFKEWAACCTALMAGRCDVILRKGGIHERRGEFRPEHDAFWLMATRYHQAIGDLAEHVRDLSPAPPPAGTVLLPGFCRVTKTARLTEERDLDDLRGRHPLSEKTARMRFHHKTPGLWALTVEVWVARSPILVADSPRFGGCRSWVDLPAGVAEAPPAAA